MTDNKPGAAGSRAGEPPFPSHTDAAGRRYDGFNQPGVPEFDSRAPLQTEVTTEGCLATESHDARGGKHVVLETTRSHTPGPWIARPWRNHSPTTIVREVNGQVVPIADVDPAGSGYLNDPETIANARLIAAAPDLLALAHDCLTECAECEGTGISIDTKRDCESCSHIREVIAKAEGRA